MTKLKSKIKDLGKVTVALQIFKDFAGNGKVINPDSEAVALAAIQKSLDAYGKSIFALRVNMPCGTIAWHNGMQQVLGRADLTRYDQFEGFIQPDYLATYNFWSTCLFQAIARFQDKLKDLNSFVYHIRVPLKNSMTQKVSWYNQHSIALIDDKEGGVLSFLSLYTFDSEWFVDSPIVMLPAISQNNRLHDMDKNLKTLAGQALMSNEFTKTEQEILDCYSKNIKPLEHLQMKPNTLYDHHVNILDKAKTLFQYDFPKAQVFAKFLKNNSLIVV
jgi:hypothetical protein